MACASLQRIRPHLTRGFTLVELMVAMTVGLIVVLAATGMLIASRQGATTVDAASQLRDDARFATDMVQRLAVQTGFEDLNFVRRPYMASIGAYKGLNGVDPSTLKPSAYGYTNATPSATDPLNSANTRASGSLGYGSDVLILQYDPVMVTDTTTDGSMIMCTGGAPTKPAIDRDDRTLSILYVSTSSGGEPALMCMTRNESTGVFNAAVPLLKGVESFKVLYGTDNVTPNATPAGSTDSVPDRYLRAEQMTVAGSDAATLTNWRRVRSLRIGMVLRGPVSSAQSSTAQTLFPLGAAFTEAGNPGSTFTATDSRLRQVVTFTVQLRNCQNQGYQPAASTSPCDVVQPS